MEQASRRVKKLKELHLNDNNFTGVLPDQVGRWASLLILDLSNNKITGKLPSDIGTLNNLITLDVSDNLLIGIVPSDVGKLSNLAGLNLRREQPNWTCGTHPPASLCPVFSTARTSSIAGLHKLTPSCCCAAFLPNLHHNSVP
ncbi:hypothetical protein EJB05_57925, partial [Eragrostis curvula]